MNNPLNELSAVYQENIAEGEKKGPCKRTGDPVCNCTPEGDSPDGGDGAKGGKDKNYVKPMGESKEGLMKVGREQYKKEKEAGRYGGDKPSNPKVAALMKKMKEETTQDGPEPTRKQRKGAMDNIRQNMNRISHKDPDKKSTKQELAFQKARAKAFGMKEESDHDKEVAKYREQAKKKTTMPKGDVGHDIHKRAVDQYNKQNPSKKVKEGYAPGDVDQKLGAVTSIPKKEQDAARERLLAKAKAKREAKMKEDVYHNWREGWEFLDEYNMANYGTGDSEKNLGKTFAKTDKKANEKITEKNVKNTIKINPPQGMGECFAELGGVIHEVYEITEKIDIEKADMGEVIKDFRKSKAPQFKGKSKAKKQQMAVAAKLATEETEEEKKKREQLQQKTKDHDDKQSGRVAEAYYGGEEQRKKDEKKKKIDAFMDKAMPARTFDQMGRETDRRTGKLKEGALSGVLSTIRAKNGMKDITSKGKDKVQAKKEMARESALNPFQYHPDKKGTDKGTPEQAKKIAKNISDNRKKGPMKYDPYKGTDGRD